MWRFALAVFLLFVFAVLALSMAPPAYRVDRHGLFGLVAQRYKKAWICRAGLVAYALIMTANMTYDLALWRAPRPVVILLLIGSLCYGLTVIFAPSPLLDRAPTDDLSARRHHRMLMSGLAFYLTAILYSLFMCSKGIGIFFNLTVVFMVIFSVLLSLRYKKTKGLYETLAFVVSILWPIFLYPTYY